MGVRKKQEMPNSEGDVLSPSWHSLNGDEWSSVCRRLHVERRDVVLR